MATTFIDEGDGVWVRMLDDRVLSPAYFQSLSAATRKSVQFVPVRFDNEEVGDLLLRVSRNRRAPLDVRMSIVPENDDGWIFLIWDTKLQQAVGHEEMMSNTGPYGPPHDPRRDVLRGRSLPKELMEHDDLRSCDIVALLESPRLVELDASIIKQLRRRLGEWPMRPIAPTRHLIDLVEMCAVDRVQVVLDLDGPFKITQQLFVKALTVQLGPNRTNIEVVKMLLEAGVDDLDVPSVQIHGDMTPGATPFFAACYVNRLDCAMLILENERARGQETSIDKPLQSGASPLHFACQEGHETVARFLITQRADVNKTRGDGGGPLFAACQNGFPQLAAILLASNAKLEHGMQRSGTTPLMAACLRGCTETVELLLSAGADVSKTAKDGHTALSLTKAGHKQGGISKAKEKAIKQILNASFSTFRCPR